MRNTTGLEAAGVSSQAGTGLAAANENPSVDPVDFAIGRRIRRRRRELDLTLEQLGPRVGVGFKQIHKYERGINRIAAATLVRFARALEVEVAYFFEDLPRPGGA